MATQSYTPEGRPLHKLSCRYAELSAFRKLITSAGKLAIKLPRGISRLEILYLNSSFSELSKKANHFIDK
jgi:hypothetical protein